LFVTAATVLVGIC